MTNSNRRKDQIASAATLGRIPAPPAVAGASPSGAPSAILPTVRATIRMYRHGLGDCHLITLHGKQNAKYRILIDCGVILGTPDSSTIMTRVMDDVLRETDGSVDLLVATHEHWDHVSGFIQASDSFAKLDVREVWLAWTENANDPQAQKLGDERGNTLRMVRQAAARMQLAAGEEAIQITSLLEFFGVGAGLSTKDALEAVRGKTTNVRYCDPGDPPTELGNFGARIYVLGPPRDEKLLKRILPSAANPETYSLAVNAFGENVLPALGDDDDGSPFGAMHAIPDSIAQEMPFFASQYWQTDSWRRIDVAWMSDATQLALALDSATNNTSLVLAIELEDADVLLFAADAQVGNWLSWQDLKWKVGGKDVTGPDLLKKTLVYKVGHHGSHNATLREKGLELMEGLRIAMIPVDHEMAQKKRWGKIPLEGLLTALDAKCRGFVLRSDQPARSEFRAQVREDALFFEIEI
jgi:beta-lactamase superfamily II metal-dependent hydrolase